MKKEIPILIIAVLVVLSIVIFTRPGLAGGEAYQHILAAQSNAEPLTQYDYILRFSFLLFEPVIFMKIFPVLLGIACGLLFFLAAKKFMDEKSAFYSSLIFIVSPTFLYIFSINSSEIVSMFLLIAGVLLLVQKEDQLSYLAVIPFILASLSSIFVAILVILVYLSHFLIKKEKRIDFVVGSVIIALLIIIVKPEFMINYTHSTLPLASNLFSDFGGLFGISIFTAIFSVGGLIASKKRSYFYPIIAFLVISFIIDFRTIIYSNLLVCAFAGIGMEAIIKKKWKLRNLKQTMNFLMICGIFFSAVSHINIIRGLGPSNGMIDALGWLGANSDAGDMVFSRPNNGFFIEYFAGRQAVSDPLSAYQGNQNAILNDSMEIYYSRTLEKTEKLLNKYNISYILIDPSMTGGGVWTRPNEGLLFLLTNEEKFPTVYNKGGIRIIYYAR